MKDAIAYAVFILVGPFVALGVLFFCGAIVFMVLGTWWEIGRIVAGLIRGESIHDLCPSREWP
jgi:hypothetical protein